MTNEHPATTDASAGPAPRKRVTRWLTVPTTVLALVATVIIAWAGAHPTGNVIAGVLGLVIAGLAGLAWLWIVILAAVRRRFAWSIIVVPVLVLGAVVAVVSGAAERAGFELAKPVMAQAVANGTCPQVAGVLPISSCHNLGDSGRAFMVGGAGFLNQAGWVYFSDDSEVPGLGGAAEPGEDGFLSLEPRGDGWYRYIYVW